MSRSRRFHLTLLGACFLFGTGCTDEKAAQTRSCSGDQDCPSKQVCSEGVCIPTASAECTSDEQCPGGQCNLTTHVCEGKGVQGDENKQPPVGPIEPPITPENPQPDPGPVSLPFWVDDLFVASGYMGDSDQIEAKQGCQRPDTGDGPCHQFTLQRGSEGWGGVFWSYPADNWGTAPGLEVEPGATRVAFTAWVDQGEHAVKFRAGGLGAADKPEEDLPKVEREFLLTTTPRQLSLDLRKVTYKRVIAGFAWAAAARADGPISIFIDDIVWQKEAGMQGGCTDPTAANYDSAADTEDGSCQYPITFQVNASTLSLAPGDQVYLQSTFNQWCGRCNPLEDPDRDGIWTVTLPLGIGEYAYKYTTNGWDGQIEDVPVECGVTEGGYTNRKVKVSAPLTLPVHPFGGCPSGR